MVLKLEEEERKSNKKFVIIIIIAFAITAVLIISLSLSIGATEEYNDEEYDDDFFNIQYHLYFCLSFYSLFMFLSFEKNYST